MPIFQWLIHLKTYINHFEEHIHKPQSQLIRLGRSAQLTYKKKIAFLTVIIMTIIIYYSGKPVLIDGILASLLLLNSQLRAWNHQSHWILAVVILTKSHTYTHTAYRFHWTSFITKLLSASPILWVGWQTKWDRSRIFIINIINM